MWNLLIGGAAVAALLIGSYTFGSNAGWTRRDARAKAEQLVDARAAAAQFEQAQADGFRIGAQYAQRTVEIRTRTEWLTSRVRDYVTPADDARAVLNLGFVRLHDAAAAGVDPAPVTGADAAPSGVALSAATRTLVDNYGSCHLWRAQVIGLQDYVTAITGVPAWSPPLAAAAPAS